jgi:hypothetical protein
MKDLILIRSFIESFDFKYKLIEVQEVVVNQFFNLSHIELHPITVTGDQIRTQ